MRRIVSSIVLTVCCFVCIAGFARQFFDSARSTLANKHKSSPGTAISYVVVRESHESHDRIRPIFDNLEIVCGTRLKKGEFVLTFDDGPNDVSSPILLDTLKRYNVSAMFFCTAVNMRNVTLLHRARTEGHIIGGHTYGHNFFNHVKSTTHNREIFYQ